MSAHHPFAQVADRSAFGQWAAARVLVVILLLLAWMAPSPVTAAPVRMDNASDIAEPQPAHLVVSEVVTGGSSASDEFVELFNPGPVELPLEGLELVYVTATGATISRKASWAAGAPAVPSHRHLLIANAAGIYAGIADATYASGLAATGGSLALRIQGGATAVDALAWGTSASAWMEGAAAPAAPTGASLERLPGGSAGSSQDTDDNLADFAIRGLPDPQNSTASPTPGEASSPSPSPTSTPGASATPTSSASATPTLSPGPSVTPTPTPTATPTVAPSPSPSSTATPAPAPTPISIAAARSLPDGSAVLVGGVALSGSGFSDGGGYLDDGSAGIAVLLADGAFARGDQLTVAGTIDDRYAQRTLRAGASDLAITGTGSDPAPTTVSTGAVGEPVEGRLVSISGQIQGAATTLSGGLAFDLDDGSGAVRVFVASAAAIATDGWSRGATLTVVGVVGQRDSSGTGTAGYRVQPRDPADVLQLLPAATPSPVPTATPAVTATPTASPVPSARPTPTPGTGSIVSIAAARAAATGARLRIRGTVTLSSGVLDAGSAVIQDSTGGILVRLGDEAGSLRRGEQVELGGTRSTKSGMLSLRVTEPPISRSAGVEPAPASLRTGSAGEEHEARLVQVRGAIATAPRRSSAGSISFDLDDGSGALRVFVPAALGSEISVPARGAWVEMFGILGQETTGALPLRGYRLWPRAASDLRVVSLPVESVADADAEGESTDFDETATGSGAASNLGGLLPGANAGAAGSGMVRATLVHGPWPELGLAGLLWDGRNLVGLVDGLVAEAAVNGVLAGAAAPIGVKLQARTAEVGPAPLHLPLVTLRTDDRLERSAAPPAAPLSSIASATQPAWARLVGTLTTQSEARLLVVGGAKLVVERHCADPPEAQRQGLVMLEGILATSGKRLVIGCDGMTNGPTLAATQSLRPLGDPITGDAKGAIAAVPRGHQPALPPIALVAAAAGAFGLLGLGAWRTGLLARLAAAARRERPDAPEEADQGSTPDDVSATSVDGGLATLRLAEPVEEVELPLRR